MKLLKNKNNPSNTTTMAWIAFLIVTVSVVLGLIGNIQVGNFSIAIVPISPALVAAYLTPILGLYGYRRKIENEEERKK